MEFIVQDSYDLCVEKSGTFPDFFFVGAHHAAQVDVALEGSFTLCDEGWLVAHRVNGLVAAETIGYFAVQHIVLAGADFRRLSTPRYPATTRRLGARKAQATLS